MHSVRMEQERQMDDGANHVLEGQSVNTKILIGQRSRTQIGERKVEICSKAVGLTLPTIQKNRIGQHGNFFALDI